MLRNYLGLNIICRLILGSLQPTINIAVDVDYVLFLDGESIRQNMMFLYVFMFSGPSTGMYVLRGTMQCEQRKCIQIKHVMEEFLLSNSYRKTVK